jgi:hypothetical protein
MKTTNYILIVLILYSVSLSLVLYLFLQKNINTLSTSMMMTEWTNFLRTSSSLIAMKWSNSLQATSVMITEWGNFLWIWGNFLWITFISSLIEYYQFLSIFILITLGLIVKTTGEKFRTMIVNTNTKIRDMEVKNLEFGQLLLRTITSISSDFERVLLSIKNVDVKIGDISGIKQLIEELRTLNAKIESMRTEISEVKRFIQPNQ